MQAANQGLGIILLEGGATADPDLLEAEIPGCYEARRELDNHRQGDLEFPLHVCHLVIGAAPVGGQTHYNTISKIRRRLLGLRNFLRGHLQCTQWRQCPNARWPR